MLFSLFPCFLATWLLIFLSIVHWELCCNWFRSWFISANVDSKERLLRVIIPLCVFKLLDYSVNYFYKFISSMNISYEDFTTWHFGKGAQCISFVIMLNLWNVQRHLFFYSICQAIQIICLSLDTSNHFIKIT